MGEHIWSPIATAPQNFEYDVEVSGVRFRGGPAIKVRGTHDGELEEFTVHWSQIGDGPAHWFIFDCEPLDWPADEWRPLTAEEEVEIFGEAEPA